MVAMISPAAPDSPTTVPFRVRLGYAVGSFCTANFLTIPGLLLLYYMTELLAVPAWLAGIVLFLPKAWDLLLNPLVGQWSDRTRSRWGPRRPWLLAGAAVLPVSFAAMFAGPPLTGTAAAAYVGAMFLVAATGYALYEVPYKAMPAEMTTGYHERTRLLEWRMIFVGVSVALSGIVAPMIAGNSLSGYRLMGIVFGAILLAAMLGSFFGTVRAPYVGPETTGTLRAQLAALRSSRPFLLLLGFSSAQNLAVGIMLAGAPYFAAYTLGDPGGTSAVFAALVGPMLVTNQLWTRVARRLDKRGAMILAGAFLTVGGLMVIATPVLGAAYAYLAVFLIGLGYAGVQLLQYSMLADVIAHDSAVSGERRGGVFTGLWNAIENAISALGATVYGLVLGIGGFISSDPATPVAQPHGALVAVLVGVSVVPAVIAFTGVLLTLKYDLTADRFTGLQPGRPAERPAAR